MKTKYPSMFGLLVALMLVASFVIPVNLASPAAVQADPGICKWDTVLTPGALPLKNDILNFGGSGSENLDMAVGGDGATILVINRNLAPPAAIIPGIPTPPGGTIANALYNTTNGGISWTSTQWFVLHRAGQVQQAWTGLEECYQVAIAPDDPKFWAVTTDAPGVGGTGPRNVWVTTNGGSTWSWAGAIPFTAVAEMIRAIDISPSYGGNRDIAVATADAVAAGNASNIYVVKSTGFGGWLAQLAGPPRPVFIDFEDIKFSPSYGSDASLAVVFSDNLSTFYNIALRDLARNTTTGWQVLPGPLTPIPTNGIEITDPSWLGGASPSRTTLNNACIQLPSDFSGQAASLRRAYVSLDCFGGPKAVATDRDGIFRIDDTTVYTLMDTTNQANKSIYSIAYFGTYASGKLLAGERMGFSCTATVPTWFTDSPTTCPVPCWYPALKPTTGAAGVVCAVAQTSVGGAIVGWRADGNLAYVVTGSRPALPTMAAPWYANWLLAPIPRDESAFAISRNNGETWNQLGLIDTGTGAAANLTQLVDVAPTPDCKTVYLATVDRVTGAANLCNEFDSVWRSSSNSEVVAPLPAVPVGIYWERILCRVTAPNCTFVQQDNAILRLVPYCADPSGQIVAWAVYDPLLVYGTGVAMWSPDYGDYWATVTPRDPVQDFCFESATVMYFLSPGGNVQKMPYTGTAWANTLESVTSVLPQGHTIAAYPEGKVLVGTTAGVHVRLYAASYSANFNTDRPTFSVLALAGRTQFAGNVHVAFDPNFKDNNTIFIADDDVTAGAGLGGSVYRNNVAAQIRWDDGDMMAATNGAIGSLAPHAVGQYGLALAFTGADKQTALYSAHRPAAPAVNSGVCRTLWPLDGMPKPGIVWDCLNAGIPAANLVAFTREPSSLKLCGCCTMDTDTTLYALDNRAYVPAPGQNGVGMLWAFTDCLAKKGPKLITADKALIGCDPVSGRAQEVNLCWEQLCIADAYDIEIAKKADFAIRIIDWVVKGTVPPGNAPGWTAAVPTTWPPLFLTPADVTIPCAFFPAGGAASLGTGAMSNIAAWGNLECGHTYYWRIQVRECATTQIARSPWSEVRSFTIKAGLPVSTPYYGVQLLAPNNGGLGIPVKPVSFSWSPFKETTKYKFVLAKDAAMTQVVKEADVTTTAFEYDGTLEYSSNYFWRVQSVEPAPSDWSATFSFLTEAAPAVEKGPPAAPPTPVWVWVVIALGAILVIVTLVLIFKTRRV